MTITSNYGILFTGNDHYLVLLLRSFFLLEVIAWHQSRDKSNSSCSLGWEGDILHLLLRFREVGSRINWVRVCLDKSGSKTALLGSIETSRFKSSGKRRSLTEAVARHSVSRCCTDSTGARQRTQLQLVLFLLPSNSLVAKSPESSLIWDLSLSAWRVSLMNCSAGCGRPARHSITIWRRKEKTITADQNP